MSSSTKSTSDTNTTTAEESLDTNNNLCVLGCGWWSKFWDPITPTPAPIWYIHLTRSIMHSLSVEILLDFGYSIEQVYLDVSLSTYRLWRVQSTSVRRAMLGFMMMPPSELKIEEQYKSRLITIKGMRLELDEIRVFKAGISSNTLAWNNRIGRAVYFVGF